MKRVSTEAFTRLDILRGQIYAACRMGSWCFGLDGHLYFTTAPHEEEYRMLLQTGGVFQMAMEQTEEDARPRILNGSLGLTWIAEWVHEQDGGGTGFSRTVRECMGYVRMNYMKPLKMEDLARQCGCTEYYLTRKFMKETGMKLTDYIRSVRIDAAKVMLLASKKDIQQISEELQFGSRNYFDRVFRLQIGVSPAQYRANPGQVKPSDEAESFFS